MLTRLAGILSALALLVGSPHAGAAAPKAYVGLFKDSAVAVLDTDTDRVVGTIPVPPGPHGLVVTPDGRKVYVSSDGASTVSVIDTATDRVIGSIEVGATPHGVAISRDGGKVVVSGFGVNQALVIDTATDLVVGRIAVPQPHNAAVSPDGRVAWVGSQAQGAAALVAVDLDKQSVIATGEMRGGVFVASEVLAKHDENYVPRDVAEAMENAHRKHDVPVSADKPTP